MPNIDTTQITGFDEMTAEQKLDALLKFEIPEQVDMSKFVSKETFDKKASEAADWKKKHNALLSEDEQKKQKDAETLADMQKELETLRKDKTVSEYTAKYIALGYDSALAADTAKAMADGDMAKVFANGETHKAALEKKIKEDLMNKTPKPGGAGGNDGGGDNAALEQAKRIGQAKAEANKTTVDVLKHYL